MSKKIPKKYMLILQKRYGGQEAVEFFENGEVRSVLIKPFSDEKIKSSKNKDSKVLKNTLAFYDAITNRYESFDRFLSILDKQIYTLNYKENSSYIGFLNNGFMNRISLSFNDDELAKIALATEGNNINIKDKGTLNVVTDIVDMIENEECDFVDFLKHTYDNGDNRYNFSRSLINIIMSYRVTKKTLNYRDKWCYIRDDNLVSDLDDFKKEFLEKIYSYKNFRELYRFRKQYLHDKEIENQSIPKKEEQVVKKKCRKKFEDVPGQIHFSDILN